MKSLSCLVALTSTARLCAKPLLLVMMLACLVSCAANGPKSRYVFMKAIDDRGQSSGPHAVTICLPPGYGSTDRRYPVIYLLDGESAFLTQEHGMQDAIGYEVVHDQLVHEGLIEPAILVAVHNSSNRHMKRDRRLVDYCIEGQTNKKGAIEKTKSDGYYQYLAQTIKPMIDKKYRTRSEPESTGVAGFSASAAGAFWMTYMHPETFGMAICQSAPFWAPYEGKEFKAVIEDTSRPIPPVRIWLDAGSLEYDFIYKDAYQTYATLIGRGFRHNENIAFYTGHNHGHEKFDCNRRMRSALYFMLRKATPKLTDVQISEINAEDGGPIKLAGRGRVVLETIYDNWFSLTDCTATFAMSDPSVVSFNDAHKELQPRAAGHTTITSSFGDRKVAQQVEVLSPEAAMACPAAATAVVIDGDLAEWPSMEKTVKSPIKATEAPNWKGSEDLSYRIAYAHNDAFLYIAIETTDDFIKSKASADPWFQDGVEVRVDARPMAKRMSRGEVKEGKDVLLVAISPTKAGEARLPHQWTKLPTGTRAVCKVTTTGHNTEIAIPVKYLNDKAGTNWADVRLNVVVNDLDKDSSDVRPDKFWWRPDWRTPADFWGSGTLQRQ